MYGSRFSKGKREYYTIIVRGIPEERPKDCVVELYATIKKMPASEIMSKADRGNIKPISRSIILGNMPPVAKIEQTIESMKRAAKRRENNMQYGWVNF